MTTQKDIAEKLGVSVALVSRALSGKAEEATLWMISMTPPTLMLSKGMSRSWRTS